jgi:hypothetical protein
MCIIIDVNTAHEVFSSTLDAAGKNRTPYSALHRDISAGRLPVVHGGKLTMEFSASRAITARVAELSRAGRAHRFDSALIAREANALVATGQCLSDDPHILALARISGARLVCTQDAALITDFKNRAIISGPRGKVWSATAHSQLRKRFCNECHVA